MLPPLAPSAVALYERVRAELLAGRGHAEGLAALRFHGMLPGLAILLATPLLVATPSHVPACPPLPRDSAIIRLLANLVLNTHEEPIHVC